MIEDVIIDFLSEATDGVVDVAEDVGSAIVEAVNNSISYISENGVDEALNVVKTTASTAVQALIDKIK